MSDENAKRAEILAVTIDMIAQLGSFDFKMEKVAEKARVSTATLYRLWPNKDGLARDALAQVIDETWALVRAFDTKALPPLAALHACVGLGVLVNRRARALGLLRAVISLPQPAISPHAIDFLNANMAMLERCYDRAMRAGLCREMAPATATSLIGGAMIVRTIYPSLLGEPAPTDPPPPQDLARELIGPFLTPEGEEAYAAMHWAQVEFHERLPRWNAS